MKTTYKHKWPFSSMDVNDTVTLTFDELRNKVFTASKYAHTYGSRTGKKFSTKTHSDKGGFLVCVEVTRIA